MQCGSRSFYESDLLMHRAVLAFVDNDPARHAIVRGGSPVADIASVVDEMCGLEVSRRILLYFERVPSQSNIADPPSRGERPGRLARFDPPVFVSVECAGDGVGNGRVLMGMRDLAF